MRSVSSRELSSFCDSSEEKRLCVPSCQTGSLGEAAPAALPAGREGAVLRLCSASGVLPALGEGE